MSVPVRSTPFPISFPPEMGSDTALVFEEEQPSESRLHAVVRAVALAVADPKLHESLFLIIRSAGRVIAGDDILPVATVVITDASGGATPAVSALRARARSDAAIIVVLDASAPATEIDAAYEAGAVLCLRAPIDEHQLLAAIGSAIDLHEAKVHADDLMRRLDVQSRLASLGRVTAGFTHEVSNPLTVLATNFETTRENIEWLLRARDLSGVAIEQDLPPPMKGVGGECLSHIPSAQDVRGALEDMGTAIDRINGVLATARSLAGGSASSRVETVDLASVVGDVRRWAANELQGVEVEELIDEPIVAHADPRLLGQIVLNLVTNAAHAACQLPSPRVRIHVYGSKETAIVSVRDNGPGIPPDIRDRIFEPFFTTRRGQGGTGLGLALCQEFAAQMQAEITVWTAPGRGACFRVHLRRATR